MESQCSPIHSAASSDTPVQLRYCPRCGALGVAPADAGTCPACRRVLAWIYGCRGDGRRAGGH